MLHLDNLHEYQVRAIRFVLDNPSSMLWLDMGLGKTTVTLHALRDLMDRLEIGSVAVIAPKRVCETVWRQEARNWSYTRDITFSVITGDMKRRRIAMRTPAMIYLVNYENVQWWVDELRQYWIGAGLSLPFNGLILDEISRLKSTRAVQGSKRGQALRSIVPYMRRIIGLTGTPASNGWLDLYGQYLCVDGGARLGKSFEAYKKQFFYQADYSGYSFLPFRHSLGEISTLISDITLSMSNEEYLSLPPVITNDIWVDLPEKAEKVYRKAEKEFFVELDSGATVDILTKASLSNRCLQIATGACYLNPGDKQWESIHDAKLKALEEVVEEAAGKPLLIAYQFQHDAERILKRFRKTVWVNRKVNEKQMVQIQNDWNDGKIQMLMGHPGSIGHGLNLQHGGNQLVWFGLNWSQDLFSQLIARLRRQGQTERVVVNRILARNTLDEAQAMSLEGKQGMEHAIRSAIATYREKQGRVAPTPAAA